MTKITAPNILKRTLVPTSQGKSFIFVLLVLCCVFSAGPLSAATLLVTNLSDSGPGTLRQLLVDAAPGDTITFAIQGTINLSSGYLVIDKNVQISGPGAKQMSIAGGFTVSNVTAGISDLTICKAHGYGAVSNSGVLTMTRCIIIDCTADFGGGIVSDNQLMLRQCVISGNSANEGGGIWDWSSNPLVLDGCTVANNYSGSIGGGIGKWFGALMLTNTTISGNYAEDGGGGGVLSGQAIVESCTIVSNLCSGIYGGARGGGIFGPAYCRNSIIAGNSQINPNATNWPPFEMQLSDICGTMISGGYNLVESTNDCTITGDTTGNIIGAVPLLGPLQDNGGPTPTHSLLPTSPAIDAGNAFGLLFDQRGCPRPYDMVSVTNAADGGDIGAFEFNPTVSPKLCSYAVSKDDAFHITAHGVPGNQYEIWASTNLVDWAPAGLIAENQPGSFAFAESLTTNRVRFYRIQLLPVPNPNLSALVWIPPGPFTMGSPPAEQDRDPNEGPQTKVTLTRGFYISKYLVTHGNISEWCMDWFAPYMGGDITDPTGAASGAYRVRRGGDWISYPSRCRSAARSYAPPQDEPFGWGLTGFRVILVKPL